VACVGPLQVMRAETLNVSTVPDGTSSGPVKSVRGIALSFALLKPLLAAAVRLSWPVPIGFVSPFLYTSARTSKKVPTSSLFLRPTHTLAASRPRRAFAAHAALSSVYRWFTEGFDTTDLKAARHLLAKLDP